jgi:hypothetical protein
MPQLDPPAVGEGPGRDPPQQPGGLGVAAGLDGALGQRQLGVQPRGSAGSPVGVLQVPEINRAAAG